MSVILSPEEVRERFGRLFCQGVFTIVDEAIGRAQVIEKCVAKGPMEWDAVNRRRAGGVVRDVRIEGHYLTMDVDIGEREVSFGPVSKEVGGQGLKSLKVVGDEVETTWVGLAGASVGVGACIPGGPGVIRTEYPDGFKLGGAHRIEVKVVTPKLVRVVFGVDDTDTKESGASWSMMLGIARSCPLGTFLDHRIIQLNPEAPNKTTNCCSTAVSFAVEPSMLGDLKAWMIDAVRKETLSDETTMAIHVGLEMPEELRRFGWDAKSILYVPQDAIDVAEGTGVEVIPITGMAGVIGAVAALGCFDLGLKAAGLKDDYPDDR